MNKAQRLKNARKGLKPLSADQMLVQRKLEAEGGCGVIGLMSSMPIRGRHLYVPSLQMQNRGNGKGGGIAAVGLVPEEMGVTARMLDEDYILQLAYIDPTVRKEIESEWLFANFDVDQAQEIPTL